MTPQAPSPEGFDIEGWQRIAQLAAVVMGLLSAAWVWVARIYAPYRKKRDEQRALRELEEAKRLAKTVREILAEEIATLNTVCQNAADCLAHIERVLDREEDYDEALGHMVYMGTENHMLIHDMLRVQRIAMNIPEPQNDEADSVFHEHRARIVAGIERRGEERDRSRGDDRRSPNPPRRTPPRPGGRRREDPLGPRGSEI